MTGELWGNVYFLLDGSGSNVAMVPVLPVYAIVPRGGGIDILHDCNTTGHMEPVRNGAFL